MRGCHSVQMPHLLENILKSPQVSPSGQTLKYSNVLGQSVQYRDKTIHQINGMIWLFPKKKDSVCFVFFNPWCFVGIIFPHRLWSYHGSAHHSLSSWISIGVLDLIQRTNTRIVFIKSEKVVLFLQHTLYVIITETFMHSTMFEHELEYRGGGEKMYI